MTNTTFGGEGKDLKGSPGGMFSMNSKSYEGPENWTPEDKGTKNPDDVSKKESELTTTGGIPGK